MPNLDHMPDDVEETEDGSLIRRSDGRVLFFSIARFKKDVAEGDCCFICGARRDAKIFNDEHVIPNWILRRCDLYNRRMRLPYGLETTYGSYKVPCCQDCNTLMGQTFEIPISKLTKEGYRGVSALPPLASIRRFLFNWLALIFLKTHLKDNEFLLDRSARDGRPLSSAIDWEQLHHIHCVARSFYTGAAWRHGVIGSLRVLPAVPFGDFDYRDDPAVSTMLIRVGDVAFLTCLGDSGLAAAHAARVFNKADRIGRLSRAQLREMMAHLAYFECRLSPRPYFATGFPEGRMTIHAQLPERIFQEQGYESFGTLIWRYSDDVLEDLQLPAADHARIAHEIETEQYRLLKPDWADPRRYGKEFVVPPRRRT